MLVTIRIAPGLCMSIIGILRAPTSFILYVCTSCGAYCTAARSAEDTPWKVAHRSTFSGRGTSGEAVDNRNIVVNVPKTLLRSVSESVKMDEAYRCNTTTQERMIERLHSLVFTGAFSVRGGRVS